MQGPGALDRLIAELDARADELTGAARRMFGRWLDACVPAAA